MDRLKRALLLPFTLPLSAVTAVATVRKNFSSGGVTLLKVKSINGDITVATGSGDLTVC